LPAGPVERSFNRTWPGDQVQRPSSRTDAAGPVLPHGCLRRRAGRRAVRERFPAVRSSKRSGPVGVGSGEGRSHERDDRGNPCGKAGLRDHSANSPGSGAWRHVKRWSSPDFGWPGNAFSGQVKPRARGQLTVLQEVGWAVHRIHPPWSAGCECPQCSYAPCPDRPFSDQDHLHQMRWSRTPGWNHVG